MADNIKEVRFIIGDPERGPRPYLNRSMCNAYGIDYGILKEKKHPKLYPIIEEIITVDDNSYSRFPRTMCFNNKHRTGIMDDAIKMYGKDSKLMKSIFTVIDNRKLTTQGTQLQRKRYEKLGFRYKVEKCHFADEVLSSGTRIALDDPVRRLGIKRNVEIDGNYINGVKAWNTDNDILKKKYAKEMEQRFKSGETDLLRIKAELDEKYNINWLK